jgi:hypothetical protein
MKHPTEKWKLAFFKLCKERARTGSRGFTCNLRKFLRIETGITYVIFYISWEAGEGFSRQNESQKK